MEHGYTNFEQSMMASMTLIHRMKRQKTYGLKAVFAFLLMLAFLLLQAPGIARSQDPVIWSEPENLSNTPSSSNHPAIVTDDFGFVHVFWSELVGGETLGPDDLAGSGNAIMYTRWDGKRWSVPNDVLTSPGENLTDYVSVAVDPGGRLHAVWGGQDNFYYSSANGWEAETAQSWSKPKVIASGSARSQRESSIVVDNNGSLHVIYAARYPTNAISHISSADGGHSWSRETRISPALESLEVGFANVRIISDPRGRLHATWQTFQDEGYGQGVYYARSLDAGQSWSESTRFRFREQGDVFVEWPYLVSRGEDELHLNYVDGQNIGRAYRLSLDGGETWSEADLILQELEGINGYVIPIVDGDERMHMVIDMRTRAGQVVGLYYSRLRPQGTWSPTKPIDDSSPAAPSAHYTAASVRLGNEIHAVYTQLSGGEIWHVRGDIQDIESSEQQPLPPPEPTAEIVVEQAADLEAAGVQATTPAYEFDREQTTRNNSPFLPLIAAAGAPVAAALLLVILVVGIRNSRR